MKTLLECLMISSFCIAITAQLYRYIKNESAASKRERFMLLTMGIGFAIGAINAAFSTTEWLIVFYALGVMLTYTTLLFSYSKEEIEKENEIKHE